MPVRFTTENDDAAGRSDKQRRPTRNTWNTIKPSPKRGRPYATSLTLAFALTAVMTAVVLVMVLAVVWERQFTAYTRQNMQAIADSTSASISASIKEDGEIDVTSAAEAAAAASSLSSDIVVQITDSDGHVLYDDTWATAPGAARGHTTAPSVVPTAQGALVTSSIVNPAGEEVGTVKLWALGSDALLTKSDASFRSNSYGAIATAAAIATILACVIGYFVSRGMARPIQRITSTAKQIRNGDLTARTGVTGPDEIGQLGETFDDMASTIERDIKLEHRLTGDVAHELRTPLMAMQATVEAMQDGVLPTTSTSRSLPPRSAASRASSTRCSSSRAWRTARPSSTVSAQTWRTSLRASSPRSISSSTRRASICATSTRRPTGSSTPTSTPTCCARPS